MEKYPNLISKDTIIWIRIEINLDSWTKIQHGCCKYCYYVKDCLVHVTKDTLFPNYQTDRERECKSLTKIEHMSRACDGFRVMDLADLSVVT